MEDYNIILQHGLPYCTAASAANAAGGSMEDFIEEAGPRPEGEGYCVRDAVDYLQKRGVFVGLNPSVPIPAYTSKIGQHDGTLLTSLSEEIIEDLMTLFSTDSPAIIIEGALEVYAKIAGITVKRPPEEITPATEPEPPDPAKIPRSVTYRGFTAKIPLRLPALVYCRYCGDTRESNSHVVYWNGYKILDSNYDKPQPLSHYIVTGWYPLYKMPKHKDYPPPRQGLSPHAI